MEAVSDRLGQLPDDSDGWKQTLVQWLTRCQDINLDTEEFHYFLDRRDTLHDEVDLFLSPLECAEDIKRRMDLIWPDSRREVDDSVLVDALKNRVGEMARNADFLGDGDLAATIRSVSEFQIVDEIDTRTDVEYLDAEASSAIFDLANSTYRRHHDNLVGNFWGVVSDWYEFGSDFAVYVATPMVDLGVELDAFMALHQSGAECRVTSERAVVARF